MSSLNVYLVNAGIIRYGMKEQPYRCTAFNSVYEFHITSSQAGMSTYRASVKVTFRFQFLTFVSRKIPLKSMQVSDAKKEYKWKTTLQKKKKQAGIWSWSCRAKRIFGRDT